jgi:hypothetical protein
MRLIVFIRQIMTPQDERLFESVALDALNVLF